MNVGDRVHAEYVNGEIVNGEIVKVREMGVKGGEVLEWADGKMMDRRIMLTVKCEQGYRSIYTDKCVELKLLETSN